MTHISLCSGIAGLDLAFGTPDAFYELDPAPSEVLAERFPDTPNGGDWTQLDQLDDHVTTLTGGLPCQPVSTAGRRAGTSDERWLFDDLADLLGRSRARPDLYLENVPGLLSANGGHAMARVVGRLAGLGYVGRWGSVRASDAGAPHRRERWFCVARHADSVAGTTPRPFGHDERVGGGGNRPGTGEGPSGTATHPDGQGPQGRRLSDSRRAGERTAGAGGLAVPANHDGNTRPPRHVGQVEPEQHKTPPRHDTRGRGLGALRESAYGPAVARWEALTRPAPPPLDDKHRLEPRFVEWMMGYPDGWATDILGRTHALKALGNAVCPQQAALAWEVV